MIPVAFLNLRDVLIKLYPEKSRLSLILHDAGIDSSRVEISDISETSWHSVLKEAEKSNKINDLLARVIKDYGSNPELQKVYQAYLQSTSKANQINSISSVSMKEVSFDNKKEVTNPHNNKSVGNLSDKVDNSRTQELAVDLRRDPIWQSITFIATLAMPLIQSDPRWYIFSAVVAAILSYLLFESFRRLTNSIILVYFVVVFFTNSAFSEIRSILSHMFQEPTISKSSINATNNKSNILNEFLIGQTPVVDPVTAWDGLCTRKSPSEEQFCMRPDSSVTLLSNAQISNDIMWVKIKENDSDREGWVQLRYLLFTEIADTYINLFWRSSGCTLEPRLELLPVNQNSESCVHNDNTISLKTFENNLHLLGLLDAGEFIEPYGKDSIIVKDSAGSMVDYIKVGKNYPNDDFPDKLLFPVGGVWREAIPARIPERKVCWLKSSKEWVCDVIVN